MLALNILLAWVCLAWLAVLKRTTDNERSGRTLTPHSWAGGPAPKVSIIVPARNEAHQVGHCLASLLAQDYPDFEVILVDDRSEDGTGAIADALAGADPRLRVVAGAELPAGWMGKSWANHQGVAVATGECLLFTDADTWHHPQALSTTMTVLLAEGGEMVTLFPQLVCLTFWEKVIQPLILTAIGAILPTRHLEDPTRPEAISNGQFILMPRTAYDRIGGHESIRESVVDDMSLAVNLKTSGGKIRIFLATELLHVRMYTSLREIWNGWSKNLYAGLRGDWRAALGTLLTALAMGVVPWLVFPVMLVAALLIGFRPQVVLALALSGAAIALVLWIRCRALIQLFGLSPLWALTHPLGTLVFAGILANSMVRALSGVGPTWKGRTYPGTRT